MKIPFADLVPLRHNDTATGQLALLAVPDAGEIVVRLVRVAGTDATAPYSIGVVIPDGQGGLHRQHFVLGGTRLPRRVQLAQGPVSVRFEFVEATATTVDPAFDGHVVDPAPRLLAGIDLRLRRFTQAPHAPEQVELPGRTERRLIQGKITVGTATKSNFFYIIYRRYKRNIYLPCFIVSGSSRPSTAIVRWTTQASPVGRKTRTTRWAHA